jgi:hypothetical protein
VTDAALVVAIGIVTIFGGVLDRGIEDWAREDSMPDCGMMQLELTFIPTFERIGLDVTARLHIGVVSTGAEDPRLSGCGLCVHARSR